MGWLTIHTLMDLPVISFSYLVGEEEFRVLELTKSRDRNDRQNRNRKPPAWKSRIPPPRTHKMPVDQDWPSVWPVARSFHPASVPLPLHQGWVKSGKTAPGKFANAELMKIPNFLHLTPPAIKRQCAALKSSFDYIMYLNNGNWIWFNFP